MDLFKTLDPDFGEDYSDEDIGAESSEDEIDIILHGTPEQKRKLYKKTNKRSDSSSEDDFESEMNKELQETVKTLESRRLSLSTPDPSPSEENKTEQKDEVKGGKQSDIQKFYDDIYFDSDDEDQNESETTTKKKKEKNPVLSNDDLLYDPDMDDEDQEWVDQQRKNCQPKNKNTEKNKNKLPQTDAILNCPACMTTLCRDCQRHERYANQYRAMFVSNCDVNMSETIEYPKEQNTRKRKRTKKKKTPDPDVTMETCSIAEDKDVYHPVKCTECETVVAVIDVEEIYYFFNVLASY
ncbi:hypothetical protein SNE40_010565 [Patella caerulea]|uniref:E2F-associated phosphoprotein n=1 Tax=Patella caerulea TaxID=87958 RepID=A0AAN8K1A5_PATCE